MKDLLESLDSAIFTPELKGEIQAKFAAKIVEVEDKYKTQIEEATAKIEELEKNSLIVEDLESKAEAYGEYIKEEMESKAEAYANYVREDLESKAEAYGEYIKEEMESKAEAYVEYVKEQLKETISSYLDKVVESYIDENRIAIDESVEIEKTRAMLDGLDSIIYTAGKSVVEIQESLADKKDEESVSALKAKIDQLIKENASLKDSQKQKEKQAVVEEIAKDLTLVQRDSFDRLAKFINESNIDIYRSALLKIKEEITTKVEESTTLNESKESDGEPAKSHDRFF